MCLSTTTVAAFPVDARYAAMGFASALCRLHVDPDGPNEPQQLATDRGHRLLFTFAVRGQVPVASVQPMLGLPRHGFHLLR